MTDTPLKPCPFCGGKAEFERLGNQRQSTIVACEDCGARQECGETHSHGTSWNTRTPPKVKPLEWQNRPEWVDHNSTQVWEAYEYVIEHRSHADVFDLWIPKTKLAQRYGTFDAAKAAAQADYERRILEALA